jgi:hypothetical protein
VPVGAVEELVAVDGTTFGRTPRLSAAHLGEMARRNELSVITDLARRQ